MAVQAIHPITHDGVTYKAGELLRLLASDEQRLIHLGAAVLVTDSAPNMVNQTDSLERALQAMTVKEVGNYGDGLGIAFNKKATKADMIAQIVATDGDILLDRLTDVGLRALADAEGIVVPDEADREGLLEALGE